MVVTLAAVVTIAGAVAAGPKNGDDCGNGVTCFQCASDDQAVLTPSYAHPVNAGELNCSNATQLHTSTCQANAKNKIASIEASIAADCCAACTRQPRCVSYTWFDGNRCNLFSSVGEFQKGRPCVTGSISVPPGYAPPPPVPAPGPPCADCPNIVLMFTDDQDLTLGGWDDAVMAQTKNTIQKKGMFAVNWTIHTPICAPSRAELMSGRYFMNIQNTAKTPPARLCGSGAHLRVNKGYATGLFGKCMNGGCKNPPAMAGAFDRWFEGTTYQNGVFFDNESPGNKFTSNQSGYGGGYLTSILGNKTIDWIHNVSSAEPNRPFFVYFAPHAPHSPATPAAWYMDACANTTSPRNPAYNYSSPLFHNLVARQPPLSDKDAESIDAIARKRCQTLLSVDDSYSAIVAAIEKMNLAHKTYYLVSSDHGYNLGQHRLPSNKFLLYDHSLRIPMLFMGPGIPEGAELGYRGTNVDVAPTILGLAGINPPSTMDGQNIAPLLISNPDLAPAATRQHLLSAATPPPRSASFHIYYNQGPWEISTVHPLDDWSNTYIGLSGEFPGYGTFKYGEYDPYGKQSNFTSVYLYELFDLRHDPYELHNIYAEAPAELKTMLSTKVRHFFGCAGAAECG